MFKSNKEELFNNFINKCNKIHGNKYDYSLVEYTNKNIKIKIICKIHGTFEQTPGNHINQKQGCPLRSLLKKRGRCEKNEYRGIYFKIKINTW